ncbi:hypothetical protein CGRA01v4_06846 [Colletotrichum graminicola]|nr:hypothetical protein CGRA01v4_06846 [Colletotrichum graminicola]
MATRSSSSSATNVLFLSLPLHISLYEYGYRVFLPVSRKQVSPPDCRYVFSFFPRFSVSLAHFIVPPSQVAAT